MQKSTINSNVKKPNIIELEEKVNDSFCISLRNVILNEDPNDSKYFLNYPVVYIHAFKKNNNEYDVYIGESNNVVSRTDSHYLERRNVDKWQNKLFIDDRNLKMYIIAHEHFNKSLTLDIENRLIQYILSCNHVTAFNGRSNPQNNEYYPNGELDTIFSLIWKKLNHINKNLFISEEKIKDSAIFKASPLHKLTQEQIEFKEKIVERVNEALKNGLDEQIIFVEGDTGTGKTVLTSSMLYSFITENEILNNNVSCCLLVNHDEQIRVYESISKKLNLSNKNGIEVVQKPTVFINKVKEQNKIDIALVDEAHLLLTQGKQSYQGKNQLLDIMKRAKVTIAMFDSNQVLTSEEYWEKEQLEVIVNKADENNSHFILEKQIRISASEDTIRWIDNFTKYCVIGHLQKDTTGYKIEVFDNPFDLHNKIKEMERKTESKLSRVIATYDWPYNIKEKPSNENYWSVKIGDFSLPWNRELERNMSAKQKREIKNTVWAEQPQTINEVGSTFTIQGFDLAYAGVIIGPSVKFRNGKVIFDSSKTCNQKANRNRTLSDGTKKNFGDILIQHELRVLLTRGVKGLYIYACDEELNKALKQAIE